jgi:plastocyanin
MRRFVIRVVVAAAAVTGCGGGSDGGGGTPPPPAVARVTIAPATTQSIIVGQTVAFSAQPEDAQGNSLTRTVTWTTSDASKVSLSATTGASVTATGVAVGSAVVTAAADTKSSGGVTVSVAQGGPFPTTAGVTASADADTFVPNRVDIAAGGTVTWTFGARAHNVTFVQNKPTDGDIAPGSGLTNTTAARSFPTAGTYDYTCTLHVGMNGTVVVH